MKLLNLLAAGAMLLGGTAASLACSRVVYLGDNNDIILIGRTLDWKTPIPTNIYVYPAGIEKSSMPAGNCFHWTSRYAAVYAVSYDGGVTEGMNEAGLSMNGLFCRDSEFPLSTASNDSLPVMSNAMLVAYFLDNFSTVAEVDEWLHANPFVINGKTFDNGTVSLIHWGLTDRTGDSLVIEFIGGQLKTYRSRDYTVLTNDPQFPDQLAICAYWTKKGGTHTLPGTVSSPDRFSRASFFINHVPKNSDYTTALASISSIMGTVSVPFGYEITGEPNVSSTQWRTISDITGNKYYFRFADSTGDMWVDLNHLLLTPGAPILKLDTTNRHNLTGCINDKLTVTDGFTPMW